MRTWQLVGLLSVAPILYAVVLWVALALAGLTHTSRGGWSFDARPVAVVAIGGGIPVIAATIVVLAYYRPELLRGWQVWGSAVVLAMLAFVATLLVMRGVDHWDWSDERQMRRFLIDSWIALGTRYLP